MAGDHLTLVNYYDRLFDQELTSQYSLSIRIDPDGLSFSVYSHLNSRYIVLESVVLKNTSSFSSGESAKTIFGDQLKNYLDHHSWLRNPFRQTCIITNSLNYTLVPHALYNPAIKSDYLEFVFRHNDNTIIKEHFLNSAEAWMIFALHKSISEVIEQHFNSARLLHHAGAMIETILPRFRHSETQNPVFVNIRQSSFDIIVLKDGRLRYCNSFSWKANEDLVYYLIFVLDQLTLNPESVSVMLSGLIDPDSSLYDLLQRYIRHVDFLHNADLPKPGISFPISSEHKFYDILNPGLCE